MAYDAKTERLIALKKLAGKAQTSNDKGLANEALPSGLTISAETVFGEPVSTAPVTTSLYDITGKVEYLRFQSIFIAGSDTASGRHGFELKLPADYEANTSNPAAGSYPFLDNQPISITSGALQVVPPSFATVYEAKPFYGGTSVQDSGTQIPLLDARDWYLDYFNGVFFQQDPPGTGDHSNNPDYIEGLLYIGDMLDVVVRNSGSSGGGGSGDPNASYVVMSLTSSLSAERVLTAGIGLDLTDAGAGGNVTLDILDSVVATISGSTFTGAVNFDSGLSGSLTRLTDGTSYLTAGSNVTIASASNGAVTISSTGGGGAGTGVGWIGRSPGQIDTTGSLGVTGSLHALNSNIFGSTSSDFHQFTGSLHLSSSLVGDYGLFRVDHEDNSSILFATGSGRLGINTATPTEALTVGGNISGSGYFSAALGLSGSLTRLIDGTSYMIAGSNVTISSASNGAVTIASTGGGGGGDITNASNLGSGEDVFAQKTGTILDFKGVAVGPGLNISSNTTTITLTTNFDTLARAKSNYEVTQSHPANSSLVLAGVDYSNAAYDFNLIDVFLNGQLLVSGTAPQAAAGTVDYSVVASGSLKFGFGLDTDDTVTSTIINNGAAAGATSLALNETPTGLVNGINDTFTLSSTPSPSTSLLLFINGQLITQGTDYTLATATITFDPSAIPMTGDILLATYQH